MQEITPGVWHWRARHERIGAEVSCHYLLEERVLIDALIPPEGLAWFEQRPRPQHFILSNRHHDRHAWRFQEAYGCSVHCVRNGIDELAGRGEVQAFDFGDELPGGIVAHEIDAICPDETALHISAHRALLCADGVVQWPGTEGLTFVPDELMDEPQRTKQRLRDAYGRMLALDFDVLLLAHGRPLSSGGKAALEEFAQGR